MQDSHSQQPEPTNTSTHEPNIGPQEVRDIVTPYAFGVSADLIGTPLATPKSRGFALLTDFICISLLTSANSLILALVSAWVFYKESKKLKHSRRFKFLGGLFRFVGAILLFVIALNLFNDLSRYYHTQTGNTEVNDVDFSAGQGLAITASTLKLVKQGNKVEQKISDGQCPQIIECWRPVVQEYAEDIIDQDIDYEKKQELLHSVISGIDSLPKSDREQLLEEFKLPSQGNQSATAKQQKQVIDKEQQNSWYNSKTHSIIEWFKGIASDLGLGFGWAALYFTFFTCWWKGQTPGKKLLGIKVVRLDGTTPNLWESFGRYGGYGAGLATGLLGFIQIYWDANRQAIQDKIAETLVIQTDAKKTHKKAS